MAVLTPLSLADARRIGDRHGVVIEEVRGILTGVNSNYECRLSGGGRAFLRIYEGLDAEGAGRELRLIEHLADRGVPTPRPLSLSGGGPSPPSHAGKPVAMFPWVEGEVMCQRSVTAEALSQVGAALAKIHIAGADFNEIGPSRFDAPRLMERIDGLRAHGYGRPAPRDAIAGGEVGADVESIAERLNRHIERDRGEAAPGVVIHGDLFRPNVLWRGGELAAVLDFECASRGSATFDLWVTVLAWCFGDALDRGLARALVRGYERERPLSGAERERLHDDAVLAALRFAVTRITDYELRPPETGSYRDYRRFLGRLAAIDALGPEGLALLRQNERSRAGRRE